MIASFRTQYGDPSVLSIRELEKPTPKADEVLIRVHAATVNRTDIGVLLGAPFVFRFFTGLWGPRHATTGTDFAGEVAGIGTNVTRFKVGDRVWGFLDHGLPTHAEYFCMPENGNIVPIPGDWAYQQMVACAEGAHYARNFINKVQLQPGQKAMVYGATGAIGSALIQMLKYEGLFVTAVCPTKQVEVIRAYGVDKVVDYQTSDFTNDDIQYDYVFDAVGKSSFGVCRKLLTPKGIYISSELGPGNENLYLPITTRFSSGQKVIFPMPSDIKASLNWMNELVAGGHFRPLIDRVYPLQDLAEAFRYVLTGQKIGNVVISMEQ
jgi:NADPH:quinone reductase-like Zn-dependent oxidoreductase